MLAARLPGVWPPAKDATSMNLLLTPAYLLTLAATASFSPGASASEIEAASRVDAVTVYPDAAIVTRVAEVDLSQGDNVLVFKDLPLALDPASLRLEGVSGAALTIGAVETRVAPAAAKAPDDALAAKIAGLRDEREGLQTTVDALQAKRAMIVRFSQSGPEKLSPEAKPLEVGAWPAAWDAVEAAIAKVGADLRPALDKARALDDEIKALEAERQKPPLQAPVLDSRRNPRARPKPPRRLSRNAA